MGRSLGRISAAPGASPSGVSDSKGAQRLGIIVWLAVAVVFVLLGTGIERQQPLEQPVVDRQRDHLAPRGVASGGSLESLYRLGLFLDGGI